MKEVKAYVRRKNADSAAHAFAQIDGLSSVSVDTITGFGRSRGALQLIDCATHVKIETICSDELKDAVVEAILASALTGHREDGKVFVDTFDEAWRIETKEETTDQP